MPGDMESRQASQGSAVDRGTLVTPKKSSSGLPEVLRTGANELEIVDFRIFEDKEDGSRY